PLTCLLALGSGSGLLARRSAASAVDRVLQLLDRPPVGCSTADRPLPGCAGEPRRMVFSDVVRRGLALDLDEAPLLNLAARHGAHVEDLLTRVRETPALGRRIVPEEPFCRAELVQAVANQMAGTLDDVLRRRVPVLRVADVPERTVREVA